MKQISANITGSIILNGIDVTETVGSSAAWSGSLASRVSSLEVFTGSMNAYTASNDSNIASLNTFTSSVNTTIASLNAFTSSANNSIAGLNSYTSSNNTTIASLNSFTSSANSSIASLNSYTASNNTTIASLNAFTSSANSRIGTLENVTASYATTASNSFNGNQTVTGSLVVTGQVIAQTLNVQQVTSSVVYSSGSNVFGNSLANTHQFTGSLSVTGSLTSVGQLTVQQSGDTTISIRANSSANTARILFNNASTSAWALFKDSTTSDFRLYNYSGSAFAVTVNYSTNAVLFGGSVTAASIARTGGTSGQFLKADGSVDSTSYATAASISGTTNYIPKFTSTSVIGNSRVVDNFGIGLFSGDAIWFDQGTGNGREWGLYYNGTVLRTRIANNDALGFSIASNGQMTLSSQLSGTSLSMSGTVSTGGDFYLSRTDQQIGYITRPNLVGYKKIQFSVNGGANLDEIIFGANNSYFGGTVALAGALNGTSLSMSGGGSFGNVIGTTSRLGVGVSSDQNYAGLFIGGDITTGTNQYAIILDPQLSGANSYGLFANARIKAAAAVTNAFGIYIPSPEKLSGATITDSYALYIANQTSGSSKNYSIYSSGGTNYFGGDVLINTTTTDGTNKLIVNGGVKASSLDITGTVARFNSTGNWMEFNTNVLTSNDNSGAHIRSVITDATVPTYSWKGDQNTGMWNPAADELGFATGGVNRLTISSIGSATFSSSVTAGGTITATSTGVDGTYADGLIIKWAGNANETNAIQTAVSSNGAQSGFRFQVSNGGGSSARTTVLTLTREEAYFGVRFRSAIGNQTVLINESSNFINNTKSDLTAGQTQTFVFGKANNTNNTAAIRYVHSSDGSNSNYIGFGFWNNDDKLKIEASGAATFSSLGTGTVYSNSGTLTNTNPSDRNLKTNITPITYGLQEVLKLNPVSYNWKDDTNTNKQFGFIAQEVQEILPDAVIEGEYLGLEKDAIYASLVNAIKELTARIEQLETK